MAKVFVLSPAPCTAGAATNLSGGSLFLPLGCSFFSLPLGFSLTASLASPSLSNSRLTLTLTLDFGEPMYGSRVLCETIYGYGFSSNPCDGNQGGPSLKDPLQVPDGPITRSRAKKIKEAMQGLVQSTWDEASKSPTIKVFMDMAVGDGCLVVGGGCLAVGLVIVGLWWKGCVCCDCEACRVWVVDMGLV
uniref:Uncharacterized protein n=1 Tax=Fagus sylvatica TaxID=28930 RepID=A0A2N9GBL4_FAGSY